MASIRDAVKDGTLIDVTDASRKTYIPYPTFLSSALWAGALKRSSKDLGRILEIIYYAYEGEYGFDHFGPTDFGTFAVTLEHSEEFGPIVLLSTPGAQNDLGIERVSGDRIEYVM